MTLSPKVLWSALLVALCAVGGVMFSDERREFERALVTLQDEQVALVTAIAADFEGRLNALDSRDGDRTPGAIRADIPQLLGGAIELQQADSRLVLIRPPGEDYFFTADRRIVRSLGLNDALQHGLSRTTLTRRGAEALGLPHRLAVAGLRQFKGANQKLWGVVVLASAQRLRAREHNAQRRLLIGFLLISGLVGAFGWAALHNQRRQLAAARERELSVLQRERERLLARADKMATLAALSSGVAHQIATPLGTITGRVEQVMLAVRDDAKATAALVVVHDQVQRIENTIRGLLDLARGTQPSLTKTPPRAVVASALAALEYRLAASSVSLQFAVDDGVPEIMCDAPMLEQAIINLIANALEASPPSGQIAIHVATDESSVLITVDDDGPGISGEATARAFEPFFTTKESAHGTGLGLAIAHEVVANHGGSLAVARREGAGGTRATIRLPAG